MTTQATRSTVSYLNIVPSKQQTKQQQQKRESISSCNTTPSRKGTSKLTCTIICSTPTRDIDNILPMIRISSNLIVVIVAVIVIIVIWIWPLVIKAYLFLWFNVPSGKYGKKRFLNIAFVDVTCIQPTIWVAGMILPRTNELPSKRKNLFRKDN